MTATIQKEGNNIFLHIDVNINNTIKLSHDTGMVYTAITWCDESKKIIKN